MLGGQEWAKQSKNISKEIYDTFQMIKKSTLHLWTSSWSILLHGTKGDKIIIKAPCIYDLCCKILCL